MNNAALAACRVITLIASAILCLIAVILLIIGMATPSWLVVQYRLSDGSIEEHRHGLWLDCVLQGSNYYATQNIYFPSHGSMGDLCEYKWINIDPYSTYSMDPYSAARMAGGGYGTGNAMYQNDYAQHRFLAWHISTLVLLLIAVTAGIFSLICTCCVFWTGLCSPVVALLELLAFLCSAIGCIVFFVNANRPEIRYVQIPNSAERWRVNDQIRGFSFDLSLAAMFIFLFAFLVGVFGTVLVFMNAHRDHRRRHLASKTYPKTEISTISSHANDQPPAIVGSTTYVRAHSPAIDV